MGRFTMKQVEEMDDFLFAQQILQERLNKLTNPYSPLANKLRKAMSTLGVERDYVGCRVGYTEKEYAPFAKRVSDGSWVKIGREVGTEFLCRKRLEEMIRCRVIVRGVDISTAVVMERKVIHIPGKWEKAKEEENADCQM